MMDTLRLIPAYAAVAVLAALPLAGCAGVGSSDHVRVTSTQSVDGPTSTLSVENTAGRIVLHGWNKANVEIEAVKEASSQAGVDNIRVDVTHNGGRLEIATHYAGGANSGGVAYTIHAPANANLVVDNKAGEVAIDGFSGSVSVNAAAGRVAATMARAGSGQSIDLESMVGEVSLTIPQRSDATIQADTTVGTVRSSFPLSITQSGVGASANGKIGSGAAKIMLSTKTGEVSIESR